MKQLLIGLTLLISLNRLATAATVEVGTLGADVSSNSIAITRSLQIPFTTGSLWVYIPKPVNTSYSTIWSQSGVSGSISTTPTNPPAHLYEYIPGVWIDFGARSYQTVGMITSANATVTEQLSGIRTDLARGASAPWYRGTIRSPNNLPGLDATMQTIVDNVVPGTPSGNIGIAERWSCWMYQNITRDPSNTLTFDQSDATTVWNNRYGGCGGYANLFKSGLVSLSSRFGVGITLGHTLAKNINFPTEHGSIRMSTLNGAHAWSVVDDGTQWVPFDVYHGTQGFATISRINEGIFEDESDGCAFWEYTYEGDFPPTANYSTSVTGSCSDGSYVFKKLRNPYPNTWFLAHWINNSDLAPLSDGFPVTGVPEDLFLDTNKQNTLVVSPNPARRWIQTQLYLEKDAKRVTAQVFTVAGQLVTTVIDEARQAGYNYILWTPNGVKSGVYYLRVSFDEGKQVVSRKFVITD